MQLSRPQSIDAAGMLVLLVAYEPRTTSARFAGACALAALPWAGFTSSDTVAMIDRGTLTVGRATAFHTLDLLVETGALERIQNPAGDIRVSASTFQM